MSVCVCLGCLSFAENGNHLMNAGRAFGGTANTAKTMKSAEIQTNVVDLFESHIEPH